MYSSYINENIAFPTSQAATTNSAGVQNVVIKVQSAFIYSQGEAVSKTVEDTLDIENWKKSDYKKIIRKVEEESHEENSTD